MSHSDGSSLVRKEFTEDFGLIFFLAGHTEQFREAG